MLPLSWARRLADRIRGLPARPHGSRGAGWDWERQAARALERAGYRVVELNFRARGGEIDVVAEEGAVLCFVEVKGRRSVAFGSPAESVTAEKRRRLIRAARAWLAKSGATERTCRFDVVCVSEVSSGEPAIEIIRDAFGLDEEP